MQQGGWFGAQPHAVDQHFGFGNCLRDDDLSVCEALEFGMAWENTCNGEWNGAARIRAEQHLSLRECEPPPSHFKQRHARALP